MPDYVIKGSLKDTKGQPVANVKVQAMDSDQQWFEDRNDDIIDSVWVKPDGTFEIPFDSKQFQEGWLEGNPDLYLIVRNSLGEIIHTTEIRKGVRPSDNPYSENGARLIAAFTRLGDAADIRASDLARNVRLLTSAVSAWSLYTREEMWKKIKYDGSQVPKYPW